MKKHREEKETRPDKGITRRRFLKTVGSGAAVAATSGALSGLTTAKAEPIRPEEIVRVNLLINGIRHRLVVEARWSLLYVLREKLGLTATKVGCERGECGACTVLIDGKPRYACMTLGPVQQAFLEHDAFQCGYCTPGQIMSAEGLLRSNPAPNPDEIRRAMSGNLCRCGTYAHITAAVTRAAQLRRGK
jgi:xanthine dehydrogenase YagT iron-sulfur-binding subunit